MTLPENIPTDVPIHFALVLAGAWVCLWLHVPLVVTVLLALLFIVGREAEKAITRPVGTPQDMADTERVEALISHEQAEALHLAPKRSCLRLFPVGKHCCASHYHVGTQNQILNFFSMKRRLGRDCAPLRSTFAAATAFANRTDSNTLLFSATPAMKPAQNASPAPSVSTGFTTYGGTVKDDMSLVLTIISLPPCFITHTILYCLASLAASASSRERMRIDSRSS